jgi:flagellar motor switch protein FliN/FliY
MGQNEQDEMAAQWEAQLQSESGKEKQDPPPAQATTLPPLKEKPSAEAPNPLEFILDVPLQISVQLGSTRMVIRDLLQLGQGSVVELDKLAGEPMDVLINDRLIARGEVVVVNDRFGIRLTDVLSLAERVQQLK